MRWPLQNLRTSQRGLQLNADVSLFTFRYSDGEGPSQRITLYMTPDRLLEIRNACDVILGRPGAQEPASATS